MKKTAISAALLLISGSASAAPVDTGGVFTMFSQLGLDTSFVRPAGDAGNVNVDPSITGFVDETAGTWGIASTALFFGLNWTATNGTLISAPGSYSVDATGGIVTPVSDAVMNFDVSAGQVAGLIDFAYGTTTGISVVNVWNVNADGSLTAVGVPGMENGPFPGFNAAFDLSAPGLISSVPVPAAVWLFGSGLIGLAGVVRRRKSA